MTVSDAQGRYSLPNLPVGGYVLYVSASGFASYEQNGIVLEVGNNVALNVPMTLGSPSEHVEVEASGNLLETETSSFKQVIDQKRITELPLNGRQATQLILVSGGAVTAPSNDLVGSKTYASSTVIAVAGGQGNYNNYVLDGGTNVDTFTNANLPYPFPDALREFSVESNSLPARNGLHPGALVNVVTNSGSNQWHGTLFEFLRNNIINANNFFSTAKDTLKQNQFGGTLGGKILTDRLFFFGGYQGTRNRQVANADLYCLPTALQLTGDFSKMGGDCPQASDTISDPVTGTDISATRKVPTSSISPQALNLAKLLPIAQADQFGLIKVALPANFDENQYIGRIDYTFNQRHSIFARYFITNYQKPAYYSPTNLLLTTAAGNDERVQNFTLGDTYIFSPKLVNTFHGTYARRRDNRGPTAGGINATAIGVNLFVPVPVDFRLDVANGDNFSIGCGTCSPGFFNTNTEDFSNDVDYLRGKHQIALGAEYIRTGDNTRSGYLQNGYFSFDGQFSGEPLIDFLTGQQNAFSQSRAQQTTYRQNILSAYAQDNYHITQRLSINYGLRWEPMLFPVDKFGRGSTFDMASFNSGQHSTKFPKAPAGSFFYGDAGVPKSFTDNRLGNFSPRVGLTYDPTGHGNTIFRLGGAIMYDSPGLFAVQRLTSNPPNTDQIDLSGPVSFSNPWAAYPGGNPFPGVFPPDASAPFPTKTFYLVIPRHIHTPTVNQWTASVQRDLGHGWDLSINYLGNENSHLWLGKALNPAIYIPGVWTGPGSCGALTVSPGNGKPCSSTSNTNNRTVLSLANPTQGQYYSSGMTQVDDGATSSYNGLITAIQHRMAKNFSFLANYTWSHCISVGDANGDVTGNSYEDPSNPRRDRANCGYDIRHIFNTTVVASSHFSGLHGIASMLVNNWQVAPLVRILSGAPINVSSGKDLSLTGKLATGTGFDRPNLINAKAVYTHTKITQSASGNRLYLSKAAFAQNSIGTYGNLGRNAFRGPNSYTVDASLSRTFPIHDRIVMNVRLEAFNVLNHPNFNNFSNTLSSGSFGSATAAADPRIFQIAAKVKF